MNSLTKKIEVLEDMINDPEKMNKAVYNIISSSDMNNDEQLSRAEFQVSHDQAISQLIDLLPSNKSTNWFINNLLAN